jgi:hypothetical protein
VDQGYKDWLVDFAKRWFGIVVDIVKRSPGQREFTDLLINDLIVNFLYQIIQQIFCISRLIPKPRQCANHHIPLRDGENRKKRHEYSSPFVDCIAF